MRYTRTTVVRGSAMLPRNRVKSPVQEKITLVDRVQGLISGAPVLARPVLMILAVALLPWLLAPVSVYHGLRSRMASLYVAAFGAWFFWAAVQSVKPGVADAATARQQHLGLGWYLGMLVTPFALAVIAHVRPLSRFVPCRTVAWVLVWSLPGAIIAATAAPQHGIFAAILLWAVAAVALGWRAAKGSQREPHMTAPASAGATAGPAAHRPGDGASHGSAAIA